MGHREAHTVAGALDMTGARGGRLQLVLMRHPPSHLSKLGGVQPGVRGGGGPARCRGGVPAGVGGGGLARGQGSVEPGVRGGGLGLGLRLGLGLGLGLGLLLGSAALL